MQNRQQKSLRNAALASTIGIVLVVSIAIGYFVGSYLDSRLNTSPWLMLVFTLMGIAAGFIEMLRILKIITED
jgi:F0F1-type ATP synthase assembly protein I